MPRAVAESRSALACHLDTPPGVGVVDGSRFGRTVVLEGCRGVVFLEAAAGSPQINVDLSASLLAVLMPLLARLRHLLDLDAEPAVIDAHLTDGGLAALVQQHPGLRLPGAFDRFEVAARALLRPDLLRRATRSLGGPLVTGIRGLDTLALTADRIAGAGASFLSTLGVPRRRAEAVAAVAGLRRCTPFAAPRRAALRLSRLSTFPN